MSENYITRAQFNETASLSGTTFAEADVDRAIAAASQAIDRICGRVFYPVDPSNAQTRHYSPPNPRTLPVEDFYDLESVAIDRDMDGIFEIVLEENYDFVSQPENNAANGFPFTRIVLHPRARIDWPQFPRSVEIVGSFGWQETPDDVVQACMILATILFKRTREAPLGFVTSLGGFEAGAVNPVRLGKSDPQMMGLLSNYIRDDMIA